MTACAQRVGVEWGIAAWRCVAIAGAMALAAALPVTAHAENLTYNEFKLGLWDHDPIEGKESGADINPELILASPISDAAIATAPLWLQWALQPRPTIGASFNTAGDTDQFYLGATWSWMLVRNIAGPGDGIFFSYFFGPGFNDGKIATSDPHRKALGSHILFREAADLGYQINPTYALSFYIDHISNGGLAKQNQSINDLGIRLGIRF